MFSFSRQMLLFAMLMIISSALVTGGYWFWVSTHLLTEQRIESIENQVIRAENDVSSYIRSLTSNLLFLATHEAPQGMLRTYRGDIDPFDGSTYTQWKRRMERNSEDILNVNPSLFQVRLIGVADGGREIIRLDRIGEKIVTVASEKLQQKGGRYYFTESLKLKPGGIYFSSVDLNVEYGKVSIPHTPTIRISTPLFDPQGQYFGFVIINADVSKMLERYAESMGSQQQQQQVYLLGDKNQFLVHPERKRLYGSDLGSDFGLEDQFPDLAGSIRTWLTNRPEESRVRTFRRETSLLTVIRSDMNDSHYFLGIVETPLELIESEVMKGLWPSILITLLLALGGIIPAAVMARITVRPLMRLTDALRHMSEGKWEDPEALTLISIRKDEIGTLGSSFLEMQSMLRLREEAIVDGRARIQAMVDASPNAVITIDRQGIIESVNAQTLAMFGYQEADLIGSNVSMLMPSPHRENHDGYLRHHLETGEKRVMGIGRELSAVRRDGSHFPIYLAVNRFVHHGEVMFAGTIMDISEQRLLKDTLASSTEIKRIMESTNDLFIATDDAYRISYINQRAAEALDIDHERINGASLLDEIPEFAESSFKGELKSLSKGKEIHTELQLASPAGWFLISCFSIGKSYYWQLVDITPLKQQQLMLEEQKLKLEQSNRELNDFAFVASHDLQEPLRKIQAFSDRLINKYSTNLDARGQDYLQRMNRAAYRMSELIQALLLLSRISSQQGELESIELNKLVNEVLDTLDEAIKEKHASVSVETLPVIVADPVQIRQMLQNLISNALKFHHPDRAPEIAVFAREPDSSRIELVVEDNGIGIEAGFADKVFEPFERLHSHKQFSGTGMGLSICRRIAERHGGTIRIDSVEGQLGIRFVVVLPKKGSGK